MFAIVAGAIAQSAGVSTGVVMTTLAAAITTAAAGGESPSTSAESTPREASTITTTATTTATLSSDKSGRGAADDDSDLALTSIDLSNNALTVRARVYAIADAVLWWWCCVCSHATDRVRATSRRAARRRTLPAPPDAERQ
jgi:hypothetical protein